MEKSSKIYIAGHAGLVGSAILRELEKEAYNNLVVRTHTELDLTDQASVKNFFETEQPEYVFLAAAKVGGIHANNTYPADFILTNLKIEMNVIESAYNSDVKKLLFLGSSCIYPKDCLQPIKEEYLLTGPLEPTNEPYAIAKIAGLKMIESMRRQFGIEYISAMPTNLYGPFDNFHPENSHVLPALLRKFHEAMESGETHVTVWGTGAPRREFLHVDDMASACIFLMRVYNQDQTVNIGAGSDLTIAELARIIADVTHFSGDIRFDTSKPDGTKQKALDVTKLESLGWSADIKLEDGIKSTYEWFLKNQDTYKR